MRYDGRGTELILAAGRQARGLGHSYVDSVHLLLALAEEAGQVGLLLRNAGARRRCCAMRWWSDMVWGRRICRCHRG